MNRKAIRSSLPILVCIFFELSSSVFVGASKSQPEVSILSYRWYGGAELSPAHPCFPMAYDDLDQPRMGQRCPKTQEADSSPNGEPSNGNFEARGNEHVYRAAEYVYEVRLSNTGTKAIKGVVWDYVFSEPETGKELAAHTFSSDTHLLPGQTKTLRATSIKPPSHVITVAMLFNNASGTYGERINLKRIIFADGSTWQMD
jgi:hypothetical protein